jgi:hypothetical protein
VLEGSLLQQAAMSDVKQLLEQAIAIIDMADIRAAAADGPVNHVRDEMTDAEWRRLYVALQQAHDCLPDYDAAVEALRRILVHDGSGIKRDDEFRGDYDALSDYEAHEAARAALRRLRGEP